MRVLVACEFSGIVREAFRARGHDAWSCDLEPAADGSLYHFQRDAVTVSRVMPWDLMIAHPPCMDLASSGARWFKNKQESQRRALHFVQALMMAPIPKIAIENPVGIISTMIRKPDQIIQPYEFGHPESKRTCLWLKNLPLLEPTDVLTLPPSGRWLNQTPSRQSKVGETKDRARKRSVTYRGIANAMAAQWG